jgi:hypothetical protein
MAWHLERSNQEWALDFVCDTLATGRGIRVLAVVDAYVSRALRLEFGIVRPVFRFVQSFKQGLASRLRRVYVSLPTFSIPRRSTKSWVRSKLLAFLAKVLKDPHRFPKPFPLSPR